MTRVQTCHPRRYRIYILRRCGTCPRLGLFSLSTDEWLFAVSDSMLDAVVLGIAIQDHISAPCPSRNARRAQADANRPHHQWLIAFVQQRCRTVVGRDAAAHHHRSDGAAFDVLDAHAGRRAVPRAFSGAGHARRTAIVPALTPPAWTSLMTGRSPDITASSISSAWSERVISFYSSRRRLQTITGDGLRRRPARHLVDFR